MHEVSVISEIVETVIEESGKYPGSTIESVSLKIGKLRQFVPEMMTFCYTVATKDTTLENSKLILEEIPIRIHCSYCNLTVKLEEYDFQCPDCKSVNVKVISGNELVLESIKLSLKESEITTSSTKGDTSWN